MAKEHHDAVNAILQRAEVTFSAIYAGEVKGASLSGTHPMDKWSCAFTKGGGRAAHEEFEFFTGLGRRKPWPRMTNYAAPSGAKHEWEMPVRPHAADVLNSLILDSSAVGQSFQEWCADCGFDSDSRKALATYEACQRNTDKLRSVFTREEIAALTKALQDY